MKPKVYYLNWDANGCSYVSTRPLNQRYYSTPALLYCVSTKSKKITRNGVYVGAICVTIHNDILRIVEIKNRGGYDRDYSKGKAQFKNK